METGFLLIADGHLTITLCCNAFFASKCQECTQSLLPWTVTLEKNVSRFTETKTETDYNDMS